MLEIHVLPADDSGRHIMDEHCPCEPVLEYIERDDGKGTNLMVAHQAWDGREIVEEATGLTTGRKWELHQLRRLGY